MALSYETGDKCLQSRKIANECAQDCFDWAEGRKRKALRARSEGSVLTYVTKAETR